MRKGTIAADWKPLQLYRKDIQQQQPNHELRGGNTDKAGKGPASNADSLTLTESTTRMRAMEAELAKIDIAADKAARLTKALRDKGVEAYEFHDRTESMVCIGSFDSVGDPRDDGKIEINPGIHRLMETYGPEKKFIPGQGHANYQPRFMEGIPFDPQPLPVVVPKQSIANDYLRRASYEE